MSAVSGTGGIVNVGFTCYANSVIQALRNCVRIEELFKEGNYNTILKKGCKYNDLTGQFANMIQTLSTIGSNSSMRPMGFWHAFHDAVDKSCFEHLQSRQPHDAHEFLMFILDSLHESLSKRVVMNITKCSLLTDRQKSHQKSLEVWKSSFEKQYSPFVDLFFGLFHIQIICSNCNNISHNFETFNTIKGVLPEGNTSPTLVECLEAELNDETISDYECEKCKPERTVAVRRTRVWKLPKNLIIVLKRFTYDGRKIHTPIQSISNTVELDSLYSTLSPNKKDSTFNLNSIVDHHGSATGGHYTAQSLHRSEHKWFVYDDQNVFSTSEPRAGESTYIIFLEKA